MKFKFIFLIPVLFFNKLYCQTSAVDIAKMQFQSKQVIPPGPEAAELGKYGNIPVSLFTGTPSISIPLAELKGNSLSLSVSLSYNASGYKPQDEATWVGSGWSLNAGGVITRSAMGNADDADNYFGSSTALNPPSQSNYFTYYSYMQSVQDGTVETQPDVYYYNFAGHSGKFFVLPDQTVFKKEKDLTIITPCLTSCGTTRFTIKDEQGITYTFDSVETTRITPDFDASNSSEQTYVSSWYLSRITSADGNEVIDLEYYSTSEQTLYQDMNSNKSVTYSYGVKGPGSACPLKVSSTESHIQIPPGVNIQRKFLKKITLKKINDDVAYLIFQSTAGTREDSDFGEDRILNKIKLYSNNNGVNELIKQYDLGYGYFVNNDNINYKKRLRLDTLTEKGIDSTTAKPPYLFTYNTSVAVPDRNTAAIDHWGFYNASNNSTVVPYAVFAQKIIGNMSFPQINVGDGADREPSLTGSSALMLNKIQYPTGGYTTFEYELNRAKFNDNVIRNAGGVRVKQIIDYSFQDKKATAKNYAYTLDNGEISGVGGNFPTYLTESSFIHYQENYTIGPETTCEELRERKSYFINSFTVSSNSVYGLGSFQGSHIGYSQVTETQTDLYNGQELGKTIYNYNTVYSSDHDDDIANGDLIGQSVYDNSGKLLSQQTNLYTTLVDSNLNAFKIKSSQTQDNKFRFCQNGVNYFDWDTAPSGCTSSQDIFSKIYLSDYGYFRQNKLLINQTQKIYDQLTNRYLFTNKNYMYDSTHNYPIQIEDSTSNGEKIVTTIKYAIDYNTSSTSGTLANDIKALVVANMPGTPIEKLQYRLYPDSSKKYLNGQITDYYLNFPKQIYFLESHPPLTSVTPSTITSGSFTYNSNYRLAGTFSYGTYGNLQQQAKTNDAGRSYMWDYHYQYPVAEITGGLYLPDTTIEGIHGSLTLSRFPIISYTSFETDNKGNFTFSGTPQTESTSPTGRRCYSLGSGSISTRVDNSMSYIVSYWRNSSSSYTVTGSTSVKQGGTHNGWTYFEHTVSTLDTTDISGSGLIDEVRVYPKTSMMTTSTYDPLTGITSQADVNNRITRYEYDALNRLINVKDADRNIVKNFKYNYGLGDSLTASATTLYYNADTSGIYIKNDCTGGRTPDTVAYRIPFGKHASVVSQADANNKARADIISNGQANANANGSCYYYSALLQPWKFKDNCAYEKGQPEAIRYVVPAGKYKSADSQAAADSMAQADVTANSQAWANVNGSCSCSAGNQRYINGECVMGTRVNVGHYQQEDERWICVYMYTYGSEPDSELYYEFSDYCPIY